MKTLYHFFLRLWNLKLIHQNSVLIYFTAAHSRIPLINIGAASCKSRIQKVLKVIGFELGRSEAQFVIHDIRFFKSCFTCYWIVHDSFSITVATLTFFRFIIVTSRQQNWSFIKDFSWSNKWYTFFSRLIFFFTFGFRFTVIRLAIRIYFIFLFMVCSLIMWFSFLGVMTSLFVFILTIAHILSQI